MIKAQSGVTIGSIQTNSLEDPLPSGGPLTKKYESGQQSALNMSPRIGGDDPKSPRLHGRLPGSKQNADMQLQVQQSENMLDIDTMIIDNPPGSTGLPGTLNKNTSISYRNVKLQLCHLLEMRVLLHDIITEQYLVPHLSGEQIFKDMHQYYLDVTQKFYSQQNQAMLTKTGKHKTQSHSDKDANKATP